MMREHRQAITGLAVACALGLALSARPVPSFAQATGPAPDMPCGQNTECATCRSNGYGGASPRSHLAHRAWVEARDRYEMLGANEGHDHAFNLLMANRDGAAVICNTSRGTCSGRDGGCPFGIGSCSGKKGSPTCKVGESCTGEWSQKGVGEWVPRTTVAEARVTSFQPVDCDCTSSHRGRAAFAHVAYRDGKLLTDERQTLQQNMTGARVGGPGSIMSRDFTVRSGEELGIACRNVYGALLGVVPQAATPATPGTTVPPGPAVPSSPSSVTCPAPEPHYKVVAGRCVPSCGAAGGNVCNEPSTCRGQPLLSAYDCATCCVRPQAPAPAPVPGPLTCPAPEPHYKVVAGRCVPSCGAAGGNTCNDVNACRGKALLSAYDCATCCAR